MLRNLLYPPVPEVLDIVIYIFNAMYLYHPPGAPPLLASLPHPPPLAFAV